jgi:hypothetical protein
MSKKIWKTFVKDLFDRSLTNENVKTSNHDVIRPPEGSYDIFLSFFVCVCSPWHLEGPRGKQGHDPWGPRSPEWFMKQKHIQKEAKKQKKFFNFFLFLFFCLCFCFKRSWECSREQGPWPREVLEVLNGSWNRNTFKKKQKNKKNFLNFFCFYFFVCVSVSRDPESARENRGHDPMRSSKSWMVHETQI